MARDLFTNQGSTTVSSGGTDAPAQGTTQSWTVASSSTFPAASNAATPPTQFYIADPALPSELILVTNVSGTTWSVTRGANGTTPVAHTAGLTVKNVVAAAWLAGLEDRNIGIFDVRFYGADYTGSADSYAAFQAAATDARIYAAANSGAKLLIPPGEYKLNSTVILSGGNATVEAYGAYIFAGSNNDLFRNYASEDATYTLNGRGLKILGGTWDLKGQNWGNASNGTLDAGGFSAFTISSCSDFLARDVTVRNVYDFHAFDINTTDGIVLDNIKAEGFKNNFTWHTACRLATTANIASLSGNLSVDGATTVAGDRILVKNQTTTTQNGIYVASATGWSRAADMDAAGEAQHAAVNITAGTANITKSFYQSVNNPTPGSAAMTWVEATPQGSGGYNYQDRYFSEAFQFDDGPNDIPCKNATVSNCYMGPATDGSGLLSFGRLTGSHTDSTNGLYTNMKVTGCTSVNSLSNAIQGTSWADATITNNNILGSAERGIRLNFNASNVGPRLTITGNMISQVIGYGIDVDGTSGTFGDVTINNNTITSTVMAATNNAGINVDTIDRVSICNNVIQLSGSASSKQGINLSRINGGVVVGNGIYSAGDQGIQTTTVNRVGINNNYIYDCGRTGIWLTASSNKNMVSGNSIVGVGRETDATYYGVAVSNTTPNPNTDNSIIGNKFNKFGSGNEAGWPIGIEGTNPVDTFIVGNTFGGDWGGPGLGNYRWLGNTQCNLGDVAYTAQAASTTSIGTSITAITDLSLTNVPGGTWVVRAMIPAITVGSPTGMTLTVSPASGPSTSNIRMNARAVRNGVAPGSADITAFNSAASLGALTAVATTFEVEGSFTSTGTGNVTISMTRTGGTSCTTQIGAYLQLRRLN